MTLGNGIVVLIASLLLLLDLTLDDLAVNLCTERTNSKLGGDINTKI